MYTICYILYAACCLLYTVYEMLYTAYCTLCNVYCRLYTVNILYCIWYTVHCILYTVYCILYIAYCAGCLCHPYCSRRCKIKEAAKQEGYSSVEELCAENDSFYISCFSLLGKTVCITKADVES